MIKVSIDNGATGWLACYAIDATIAMPAATETRQ